MVEHADPKFTYLSNGAMIVAALLVGRKLTWRTTYEDDYSGERFNRCLVNPVIAAVPKKRAA